MILQEFVSVWVRNPRVHKEDFWNTYIDYEICVHTNSMCFTKKISCVRRRYSEFVWLRQKLQKNALQMELPELPTRNPFFSPNKTYKVDRRMKGLQHFLEVIVRNPLLLSDSRLHLFLQSQLSVSQMELCVSGRARYSVSQAVWNHGHTTRRFHSDSDLQELSRADHVSTPPSGLERTSDAETPREGGTYHDLENTPSQGELFSR